MRQEQKESSITPAQAHYVLKRLIAERRVSPGEVARHVGEIQREIAEIETRIARLREAGGDAQIRHRGSNLPANAAPQPQRKIRKRRRRTGNPLAGSYMGYMRQVKSASKKAEFKKIKEERGFADAVAALKQHLGK